MINLLPAQYKEHLRGEEQFRLTLILGLLVTVFFVCLSLALLSIRVYLSGEIEARKFLVEIQEKESKESSSGKMSQLNATTARLSDFYSETASVSDVVGRVSGAVPEGRVYLTSLGYTPSPAGKIALKGFAPTTEDLLLFRTNLEAGSSFQNFSFPPSNWIRTDNVTFSFGFEL